MTTDPVTAEELLAEALHVWQSYVRDGLGVITDDEAALDLLRQSPQLREVIEFGLLKPLYEAVAEAAYRLTHSRGTGEYMVAFDDLRIASDALTTALEAKKQK